ncbi:hypothetical protein BV22DRAFT_5696 [Leucogyrophana mollusca]|uniref:Uncharacterized protein n=1 Tax=Leucogyrophana mollusca TaxID=85980 RepID=A0ACB8C096_9AGAM|nr:hypothetical protein BV22DRAFT_5696 [Leucogyrophana mollusca]
MPISKTLILQEKDLTQLGGVYRHETAYIPIHQHGYGRMDANTPGKGFSVDKVSSSCVFVLHCPFTRRTVVAHSPVFSGIPAMFTPMIEWVTDAIESPSGLPRHVEAVVLRGWACGTSDDELYDHQEWMARFCDLFTSLQSIGMLSANVTDSPKLLTSGAVLVDKITGRITYVELASGIRSGIPENKDPVVLHNPAVSCNWSESQIIQTILGANLSRSGQLGQPPPILVEYDVDRYMQTMQLSDETRELIRSKRRGEPLSAQSAIVQHHGLSCGWIGSPSTPELQALKDMYTRSVGSRPCELCAEEAIQSCSACDGAWYCGHKHQKDDWKNHEAWCQAHALATSA